MSATEVLFGMDGFPDTSFCTSLETTGWNPPRDFRTTGRKAISLVLWTLSDSAILVLYLKVRVYPGLLDASSTPQCLHVVGSLPSHQNIYDAAALCCKDCRHFWLHVLKIALNLRNLSLGCEDCPQSWGPNVMY